MTTIRTAVFALLLGAGFVGTAFAAAPAPAGAVQQVASPTGLSSAADLRLRDDMDERLDPRAIALIAAGIGLVGIVAGIRRRKALGALPEPV